MTRTFPQQQVRLIVPFGRDGATDLVARMLAHQLSQRWPQPCAVENHPGEGGTRGAAIAARASPQDDVLLMGTSTTQSIAATLYRQLPYRPIADFTPVALVGSSPNVLALHPSVPADSVRELITLARAEPGRLSYASAGFGQTIHLCGELFRRLAQIDITHAPYDQGSMSAYPDLLAGKVSIMFDNIVAVLPFVRSGELKALAVTGAHRSNQLASVPTMVEEGVTGYEVEVWMGVLAPGAPPRDTVGLIADDIEAALRQPAMEQGLTERGIAAAFLGPQQFAAYIAKDALRWRRILELCQIAAQ
jgi:tripartite-type tricarboxylate transporter receptor subunit TctC